MDNLEKFIKEKAYESEFANNFNDFLRHGIRLNIAQFSDGKMTLPEMHGEGFINAPVGEYDIPHHVALQLKRLGNIIEQGMDLSLGLTEMQQDRFERQWGYRGHMECM